MKEGTTRRAVLRAASIGGSGALGASVLAACGARQAPATAPAPATPLAKTRPAVTMEYWSRWPQQPQTEVEDKRAEEWSTANAPAKFVRTGMTGDYIEKLNTAFAANTGPDAYTVGGSGIPNFSFKGVALTIGSNQAVLKELPDFFEPTVEACKYEGKLNGLPYIVDIRTTIVRKDLMTQAGLDASKWPENWEDFREATKRMTKRNGADFTQVGFNVPKGRWGAFDFFMVLHEQQGEHGFSADLTRPTFGGGVGRASLQYMVDLINRDQVDTFNPPKPPANTDSMVAGLQAATFDSAGPVNAARRTAPEVASQMAVMPIPKYKQRFTYMGGTYLMASNKPKDPDSAVDFLLYLTAGKHADAINGVQNAVPPRKSAGSSEYVRNPVIKPFYDAIQTGWAYPNHARFTEIRDVICDEIILALKQEKSVQAALDAATRGVQDFLTKK